MENRKWVTFVHEDAGYMLKATFKEDKFTIYLTDLRQLWSESLSNEQVHQRFKTSNESFDFDLEQCKKEVLTLIESVGKTSTFTVEKSLDAIELCLNGKLLNFPIIFQFQFSVCDQEMFFTEVTLALMKTVKLLEEQNESLCETLMQKDREISEYMLEKGDTISKKYLITEPFDVTKINNSRDVNLMFGVFGGSDTFWGKVVGEIEKIEEPSEKRVKTSSSGKTVKVYSSKTNKKALKHGISYDTAKKFTIKKDA